MGGRPKQTFFQRRRTDGQQTREKMLNVAHSLRNANQNYNVISTHTGKNGHRLKKKLQTINAKENVEKRKPSCTVGGNVN